MKAWFNKIIYSLAEAISKNRCGALARVALSLVTAIAMFFAALPNGSVAGQKEKTDKALLRPVVIGDAGQLDSLFVAHQEYELDMKAIVEAVQSTGRFKFKLNSAKYDLMLEPNDLRAPGYRSILMTDQGPVEEPPQPVTTYKGRVRGKPNSDVRLSIQPDSFSGYIRTDDDWLFIDPVKNYVPEAASERIVVYRDADIRAEANGTCGSAGLMQASDKLLTEVQAQATTPQAATLFRWFRVATEADFEFYQAKLSNTNSFIQGILNQVDGIYMRELNLHLTITGQNVWTTNTPPGGTIYPYPYTDPAHQTTLGGVLLSQFRNWWNTSALNSIPREVAHLFTGKANVVTPAPTATNRSATRPITGIAYNGTVCSNPAQAYGLSQNQTTAAQFARLTAHEICHNLGAYHDDEVTPQANPCTGNGTIMCAALQPRGVNQFSSRTKADIAHLTGGSLRSCFGFYAHNPHLDFDGDGKTDFGVYRPSDSSWHIINDADQVILDRVWGQSGDKIVPGDYDGDGKADIAVYRPANGNWIINTSSFGLKTARLGNATDIPVPADYDGDGKVDIAVYRPSDGMWQYINSFDGLIWSTQLGQPDDIPVPGDYDGDGHADKAVFRPSSHSWFAILSSQPISGVVLLRAGMRGTPVPFYDFGRAIPAVEKF